MRWDITFGGVFPDYLLADRPDTVGKLSAGRGGDLLVVTLARPLLSQTVPAVPGAGRQLPEDHRPASGYNVHTDRKWVALP
jgi:hypothetical protein